MIHIYLYKIYGRFCNWGGDNFVVRKREGDKCILVRSWEGDCATFEDGGVTQLPLGAEMGGRQKNTVVEQRGVPCVTFRRVVRL